MQAPLPLPWKRRSRKGDAHNAFRVFASRRCPADFAAYLPVVVCELVPLAPQFIFVSHTEAF